jgi:hypothetical protein
MSGHKRTIVHISEEEYERLHRAEMEQRFQRAELKNQPKAAVQSTLHYESALREMTGRQNEFLRQISRLSESLQEIEYDASRALINQQSELLDQIKVASNRFSENTQRQIRDNNQQLLQEIDAIRVDSQTRITELVQTISIQQQSRRKQFEYAASWLDAAETLANFIASEYDHEHFAPNELLRVDMILQQAFENLQNNLPEAAVSQAQQAYREFSQLRLSLENKIHHWSSLSTQVKEKIIQIHSLLESCQTLPALDLNGQELPVLLNLEYWSRGEYSQIWNQIQSLEDAVSTGWREMPTQELINALDHKIPNLEQQIDQLIYQARLAALNSQLRINIADLVIQALEVQGFTLQDSAYRNLDYHHDYQANLTNYDGSQVLVEVIPTQQGQGQNELHIHSLDQLKRTPYELRRRSLEINRTLQAFGLHTGALEVLPEPQATPTRKDRIPNPRTRKSGHIHLTGSHE